MVKLPLVGDPSGPMAVKSKVPTGFSADDVVTLVEGGCAAAAGDGTGVFGVAAGLVAQARENEAASSQIGDVRGMGIPGKRCSGKGVVAAMKLRESIPARQSCHRSGLPLPFGVR